MPTNPTNPNQTEQLSCSFTCLSRNGEAMRWAVTDKSANAPLGIVGRYGEPGQIRFFPASGIAIEPAALREIADFCDSPTATEAAVGQPAEGKSSAQVQQPV